jgi:predicted nucleotidyltransferase
MKSAETLADFLRTFTQWAEAQPDIFAAALVGSHARGQGRPDSDIDIILLVGNPQKFIADGGWPELFGAVARRQVEDYGRVISIRVWYGDGREVEYGITTPDWTAPPLDEGARKVIRDGMRILFERGEALSRAIPDD